MAYETTGNSRASLLHIVLLYGSTGVTPASNRIFRLSARSILIVETATVPLRVNDGTRTRTIQFHKLVHLPPLPHPPYVRQVSSRTGLEPALHLLGRFADLRTGQVSQEHSSMPS